MSNSNSAGYDHTIRFWQAPQAQINKLQITPDKQLLAVAGNHQVRLFEINSNNNTPIATFDGHTSNITSLGFHKDTKWMFTSSEDGSIKIWDLRAKDCQRNYTSKSPINSAYLHPNQGEIISGDQDGFIRVWDLAANACSYELVPDGRTAIRSVNIASDGSLVTAGNNRGTCFIWKLDVNNSSFEPLQKIEAHSTYCLKTLLSPDCKYLATTSSDKTIKLWNVLNGFSLDKVLVGHTRWVWDCVFSADSAYLVSASSDRLAKLWDVSTGEVVFDYVGHTKAVTSVALNDSS